jgi:hypothetical protein
MTENNKGIFGFSFKKKKKTKENDSFVVPSADDGTNDIGVSGFFGSIVNEGPDTATTENGLIIQYRGLSQLPEVDHAIEDIVNEAIISDDITGQSVSISISDSDYSEEITEYIQDEFNTILKLLNFNAQGHDIFRNWYIDGRLYYHKIINISSPKKGLLELRPINPTEIKKVREIIKEKDPKSGIDLVTGIEEYFVYTPMNELGYSDIKVSLDSICYVSSGIINRNDGLVLSALHKAVRPANQLRMTENAQVIYRLTRAPERRIFYIDVGNMPKAKAEEHLKDIMNRYRNKMVYDSNTGELTNASDKMSMMEDFWLPRREGQKGTEITTLPAGTNLADIDDIIYFQKKLYKSLNVPISRLDPESSFSFGSSGEITRDEVRFSKHISKLRRKFSTMFDDLLKTQLLLKGVITSTEWDKLREVITYVFVEDNYYAELKESEVLRERLNTISDLTDYIGKYFSHDYVRRHVLRHTDQEIQDIDADIKKEFSNKQYTTDDEEY